MFHSIVPLQLVPLHASVPNTAPLPQSLMFARPTLSVALADTLMLLPVHAPFAGDVIVAVGGVVSPLLGGGGSVTNAFTHTSRARVRASGW